jgi:3-oxoacyl-(acyl-carrier-protein) synthase
VAENLSRRSILITGIGYGVAPFFDQAWQGLLEGPPRPAPEITAFETPEGAPAFGFELGELDLAASFPELKSYVDRTSALVLTAGRRALTDAGLEAGRPEGVEIGCAYGTTFGCLESMELFWRKVKGGHPKFAAPLPFTHSYANSPSSLLAIHLRLRGPAATFSGDYLAGMEALLFAFDQIGGGAAEAILVGASESLTPCLYRHLLANRLLSASGCLGGWGEANDGLVPGEGAVCLVLEAEESARRRGRLGYAGLEKIGLAGMGRAPSQASDYQDALGKAGEGWGEGSQEESLLLACAPMGSVLDAAEEAFWTRSGGARPAEVIHPKLCTGELFSVSPLLSAAFGGMLLSGKAPQGTFAAEGAPSHPNRIPFPAVWVDALDPCGLAGLLLLRGRPQ